MTPPFGATLFYMKGTAPPGVTMSDVYRGMYPFVALQLLGLVLCIFFRASFCGCPAWPASSTSRGAMGGAAIVMAARTTATGRSTKGSRLPSDLISEVTRLCSTIGPITMPSTSAATG